MIFALLPLKTLKLSMLVCQKWKANAESDSRLWKRCIINLNSKTDIQKLKMIRAEHIENVILNTREPEEIAALFKEIVGMPKLRTLNGLADKNLSYIQPRQLAEIINKVEVTDWDSNSVLTEDQSNYVMNVMAQETRLKSMKIENKNFFNVPDNVISLALNNLEELLLKDEPKNQNIRKSQICEIFNTMCKKTKLKTVTLENIDISEVESLTLAVALTNIENVILWKDSEHHMESDLSLKQANDFFSSLQQKTDLKTLLLRSSNITSVDPEVLACALNNLEEITLLHNMLTQEQATLFFIRMSKQSFLQRLSIMNINLSKLDSKSMAKGISKLKELTMINCSLTSKQISVIFSVFDKKTLVKLNLASNNLSILDQERLAKVVINVTEMIIENNKLSFEQKRCILEKCAEQTELKYLELRDTDLSEMEPQLLAGAINRIEEVAIDGCNLTTDQIEKILDNYLHEKERKLKNVYFINENMKSVNGKLLAKLKENFNIEEYDQIF